jgi:hypothetical protein
MCQELATDGLALHRHPNKRDQRYFCPDCGNFLWSYGSHLHRWWECACGYRSEENQPPAPATGPRPYCPVCGHLMTRHEANPAAGHLIHWECVCGQHLLQ